jgi:gliding motility-associated-like protein
MKNYYGFTLLGLTIVAALKLALQPTDNFPELAEAAFFACTATVDAGADTTLCNAGETVTLNGVVTGDFIEANWMPTTGLADPTNPTTVALVDTTTTYRLQVRSLDSDNLIINGDFSQGDTGFDTDYMLGNSMSQIGILADENSYAITNSPRSVHRSFADCDDHTSGNGNMMVVNASGTNNNVWCQTITVENDTRYRFGAWVTSTTSENPAQLRFTINNNDVGNIIQVSSNTCDWQEFSATWDSGNQSEAEICITNVNTTPAGNDFALDDITFNRICELEDEMTVTVANLNADWNNPGTICQSDTTLVLASLLTPNATPGGTWTLNNDTVTTLDPASLMPGDYDLRYTVSLGDCEAQNESILTVNQGGNAGIPQPPLEACPSDATPIDLSALLEGEDAGGNWTETSSTPSVDNAFDGFAGTFNPAGQAPGTYEFTYSVSSPPPCDDAQAIVTVVVNEAPTADAGDDAFELNCAVDIVTIGGPNTSETGNLDYQWTAINGSPIAVPDIPFTEVEQADTYVLAVTDLDNGCSASDTVVVTSQITTPTATLETRPVSCNRNDDGTIIVTNVANGEAPFLYALNDGEFTEKNEFSFLTPGSYSVTIRDQNGCDTTLQTTLEQPEALEVDLQANVDGNPPVVAQGDSVTLNILFSKPETAIDSIIWMPDTLGCSTCATTTVRPMVTSTYTVRVVDQNGCIATDEIGIFVEQLRRVFIPNAFTPNGDGINDKLYINAAQEVRLVKSFYVLNRWGETMFSRENFLPNDPDLGWDGFFNGQKTPPGVYVYVAELELANGEIAVVSGDVTLVN